MKTRKELKNAYKEKKAMMGVFQIKNTLTGKVLIEGSTNITAKWNRHQTELKFGSHRNAALQQDWTAGAAEHFIFSILSELEYQEDATIDYAKEVKLLEEMVLEELNIQQADRY